MNEFQIKAYKMLMDALQECTESDLFDSALAWDCIEPDCINQFCDGAVAMEVNHESD